MGSQCFCPWTHMHQANMLSFHTISHQPTLRTPMALESFPTKRCVKALGTCSSPGLFCMTLVQTQVVHITQTEAPTNPFKFTNQQIVLAADLAQVPVQTGWISTEPKCNADVFVYIDSYLA